MFTLDSFFTTSKLAFERHLRTIEPSDLIEVKLTATETKYGIEYGFLLIYRVVKN